MYNATNAATCLWAPQRLATRLRVLRRASIQRNDLFVNLSPLRPAYRLTVALLYATQRFVCYIAPQGPASRRSSPLFNALLLNDLFVNLLSRLDTALGNEPRRNSPCRDAQQLNATN